MLYPNAGSWNVSKNVPGEVIYVSNAAALDQPNSIRFAVSAVPDMFKGKTLVPTAGQRTDGVSILTQVREIWKIDDAADSLASTYFPISGHMVLQVPNDALVTSTVLGELVKRLVGAPYRNGTDAIAAAYNNLLHGILSY